MSSKVDLKVFEEIQEEFNFEGDLDKFIYLLACGMEDYEFDDLPFPPPVWGAEYEEWNLKIDERYKSFLEKTGYSQIDGEGGHEGGAEYCWGVFEFLGKTYKAEYSYYSYHGDEYDGISKTLKEVKPVQKTVTVWD